MGALRIAILRGDDAHHVYLDQLLASRFHVVGRVVEPAVHQRWALLQRRRIRDFLYAYYHFWRRRLLGLDSQRRLAFHLPGNGQSLGADCSTIVVGSINDSAVGDLLLRAAPDITVIICTTILTAETLRACRAPVINVHGGYLPDYRGNHCFFFAIWNRDFDRVGSTIHFVDRGIDTGDIIETVVPAIGAGDTPETLYCRAEMMAIHRLVEWLCHVERGGTLPRTPQPYRGRLYRTRDRGPLLDLAMWLRRASSRLVLPERAALPSSWDPLLKNDDSSTATP